ncbi:mannose-6-phosphate isomerase, class I [Microbacterium sp. 1P10UB]|uniref:mannose-6-phosphate isomerase, class I n=1 Tax=unclassified Microbacterium TaxID=2609290 RepID=UPI0039A0397F
MLIRLSNTPRDYAWGSTTMIAELEGREPSGRPEAEVWFGDHPGAPARVEDGTGRTLDDVLGAEKLPFLLKLLAAASPLSIQAHPSIAQAREGFAREDAAGVPRDAGHRNYRDDNHKPEVIVALRDGFEALAGLRDLPATLRLLEGLGEAASPLRDRLDVASPDASLRAAIGWLLSGEAQDEVDAVIAAATTAAVPGFTAELAVARRLADAAPGDPGIVVALLMNLVTLAAGEAVFVRAGALHAYLGGLGVEIMSASDNVLRGGLTPKHVDVTELLAVLDTTTGPAGILAPVAEGAGILRFAPPVSDFALLRIDASSAGAVPLDGPAIALCTAGRVTVRGAGGAEISLEPGQAAFASVEESPLQVSGGGDLFLAEPGATPDRAPGDAVSAP